MIGSLDGRLVSKLPSMVLVSCSGIGFECEIPLSTFFQLPQVGEQVCLHTEMIVREDSIRLFAFSSLTERRFFQILLSLNRIGPKLALSILSSLDLNSLAQAIREQDIGKLSTVPGVGKKTAERILFELKEKIPEISQEAGMADLSIKGRASTEMEVVSILLNLGYRKNDAERAVDNVIAANPALNSIQGIVKRALKILSGRPE